VDEGYVLGRLYSALPPGRIAADARDDFEAGLGAALQPHPNAACEGSLIKDVPVDVLRGRR
jgi:hypothetical protein